MAMAEVGTVEEVRFGLLGLEEMRVSQYDSKKTSFLTVLDLSRMNGLSRSMAGRKCR